MLKLAYPDYAVIDWPLKLSLSSVVLVSSLSLYPCSASKGLSSLTRDLDIKRMKAQFGTFAVKFCFPVLRNHRTWPSQSMTWVDQYCTCLSQNNTCCQPSGTSLAILSSSVCHLLKTSDFGFQSSSKSPSSLANFQHAGNAQLSWLGSRLSLELLL